MCFELFFLKHIAGCRTRNSEGAAQFVMGCRTRNAFQKTLTLQFGEPMN